MITTEIDYKKDLVYHATEMPEIIDVPRMNFIMYDGEGAPESSVQTATDFQHAMQALFGIIYTIKFWYKKYPTPPDYSKFTLAPIEGLWWSKSGQKFDTNNPADWAWTVMLRVPEFVTQSFYRTVIDECIARKGEDSYMRARLESFEEGLCVQLMHIGPYSEEGENIKRLHAFAAANGYKLRGKHHELYFGDPRRTPPEKLRTILRQPVESYRQYQ